MSCARDAERCETDAELKLRIRVANPRLVPDRPTEQRVGWHGGDYNIRVGGFTNFMYAWSHCAYGGREGAVVHFRYFGGSTSW